MPKPPPADRGDARVEPGSRVARAARVARARLIRIRRLACRSGVGAGGSPPSSGESALRKPAPEPDLKVWPSGWRKVGTRARPTARRSAATSRPCRARARARGPRRRRPACRATTTSTRRRCRRRPGTAAGARRVSPGSSLWIGTCWSFSEQTAANVAGAFEAPKWPFHVQRDRQPSCSNQAMLASTSETLRMGVTPRTCTLASLRPAWRSGLVPARATCRRL